MAEYKLVCTNTHTGKTETIESDNVVILSSFAKPDGTLGWTNMAHIQPSVLVWLLEQPAVKNVIGKVDFSALVAKFLFGGKK